jgi:hypothetical protein
MDANEYFQGARLIPDGAVAELGSIPTHTWQDYIGAKRVATDIPGIIGLTSNNQKNGYIGDFQDSIDNYTNPVINAFDEERISNYNNLQVSKEADDAINNILQPEVKKDNIITITDKKGSLSEFDVSMEGIMSKNIDRSNLKGRHMYLAHNTARDGYTSKAN